MPLTYGGFELIDYLSTRYKYQSREKWLSFIAVGDIRVNDTVESANFILKSEDRIDYDYTPSDEPEVDKNYRVVFEDDAFLVIDKPGDLPMHPSGKFFNNTLWALLKEKYENVHLINRLDRETSGLVLVAKNPAAAARLAKQFEKRQVEKDYLVLVEGEFCGESLEAKGFLEKDELSSVRKKQRFCQGEEDKEYGKSGVHSLFTLVKLHEGRSLLKVKIYTGKMHQIRATLFTLGFPIVGDKIYGVDDSFFEKFIAKTLTAEDKQRMVLPRQALHAERLKFRHPVSGDWMIFEAPLPDDMRGLL